MDCSNSAVDISVCIATFRRPQKLARLLESLQRLSVKDDFIIEVVVVDNDKAETGRATVEAVQQVFPYPMRYYVEPQQNIAHARNHAVREARGTWIAFIDDDEVAEINWLAAYWAVHTKLRGDGYFGAVLPRLEQAAPAWLDKDMFFGRPRLSTGSRVFGKHTRTTNAFVRRSLFENQKFDPYIGRIGGSDSELFSRMIDAGALFYWCNEAITYEYYPPERACFFWILQRSFSGGNRFTRIDKMRRPRLSHHLFAFVKAVGGIIIFTLLLPFEVFRGWAYVVRRLSRIAVQVGHIWGLLHLPHRAY